MSVQKVTQVMSAIADASREQLAGIEQVNGSVTQMDRVVQQNAALVAESAAEAQHMSHQAEELMELVARFKLDGQAHATPSAYEPAMHAIEPAPAATLPAPDDTRAIAHVRTR